MKNEKEYQSLLGERSRTLKEIKDECLMEKFKSHIIIERDENGKLCFVLAGIVKKGPAVKEAAPAKKVATAKKAKGKVAKEEVVEEEEEFVRVLTKKEREILTKAAKKEEARLLTLPPPPYTSFQLGIKLADYNFKELCSLWNDKSPRIAGVTQFSTCIPTIAYLDGLSEALGPLADLPSAKISSADKSSRDSYGQQLHDGINQNAASCLSFAGGNLPLFNITTYRIKSKPVYFKGQLPAQNFDLYTNVGPNKIRVKTKKNKYAKSYTVYYGVGEYDPETWSFKVGGPNQIITGVAGVMTNFIIVANTDVEGEWPDPQGKRFPFN